MLLEILRRNCCLSSCRDAFDERVNICNIVMAPARISEDLEKIAKEMAIKSIEILDGVGIFWCRDVFATKKVKFY